jgi:hypothetical protein
MVTTTNVPPVETPTEDLLMLLYAWFQAEMTFFLHYFSQKEIIGIPMTVSIFLQ